VAKQISLFDINESTVLDPFANEVLTEEEVNDITETSWLSSAHINCGITILRKTTIPGSIGGLYKVQLMVHGGFPKVAVNKWIQLLLINSGPAAHWLTAAYGFNNHPFVTLYDSKIPSGGDVAIHPSVYKSIQQLTGSSNPSVRYMPCQYQSDGFNCGVFALCFATSLASGGDPSSQQFILSEMRNHLKKCLIKPKNLECGVLVPFPEEINVSDKDLLDASLSNGLNSRHMNAVARLIKNKFYDIGALYDVNLMVTGFPYGNNFSSPESSLSSKWIQFIPRPNHQWMLAASGFNKINHRMLFDITNRKGTDKIIPMDVVKAVAQLHFNYPKCLRIGFMPFTPGTSNCSAISAIAIAVGLAFGKNPCTVKFAAEGEMKKHLVNCLKSKTISPFPEVKCTRESKLSLPRQIEVYCVCRMPSSYDELMIQCSNCEEWFHEDHHLPPIPKSAIENPREKWVCCDCVFE